MNQPEKNNPAAGANFENPFSAPQEKFTTGFPVSGQEGDATGGLIPYKNPPALIAYYLGIVALLPLVGMPFGIASIILGIIGLRRRQKNPAIKGSVHAIIGILGGVVSLLCGGFAVFSLIFSLTRGN